MGMVQVEHKIVAAIAADRKSFERVESHLDSADFSAEGWHVVSAIKKFYHADPDATAADLSLVKRAVLRRLTNRKHGDTFEIYFQTVDQQNVSSINVVDEILAARRESIGLALADAILSKSREQEDLQLDKMAAIRAAETLATDVHEEYHMVPVSELSASLEQRNLLRVAPASLNRRLGGGVTRGTHIVVVARPEAGKTLIVLTMLAGFVQQGLRVLYAGNEDPIKSVMMRLISNLTLMSRAEIEAAPDKAMELALSAGYEHAIFAGLSGGSLSDLHTLCAKHRPDVLIVDQIRNLASSKAENRTTQLEAVARGMRNMAREFNLVAVSVTQAADSASNKLILDMGDVDGSNTGIPGACDVMLMAGSTQSYDEQDLRMFKLAKNKASGTHENWTVSIDRIHSRVKDVGQSAY